MLRGWVSHVQNECVSCMVRTSQMNGVFSSLEHCLVTLAQEIWPGFARSFFLVREWIWGRDWSPLCCDSDVHLLSCVCVWVWLNRFEFNSLHLIKYYLKKKLFDGSLSRSSGYRQQGDLPQIERESSLVSVNSSCCCWNWKQWRHGRPCQRGSGGGSSSFLSKDHWRQRQLMVTCDSQWIYLLKTSGLEC